jgi:hypothetical protein
MFGGRRRFALVMTAGGILALLRIDMGQAFIFARRGATAIGLAGVWLRYDKQLRRQVNAVSASPSDFFLVRVATATAPALVGSGAAALMMLTREGARNVFLDRQRQGYAGQQKYVIAQKVGGDKSPTGRPHKNLRNGTLKTRQRPFLIAGSLW